MADFVAVIRRTIDGLAENTPDTRTEVYDKARGAVARQLRNMQPRPSNDMIDRQLQKLEVAILAVEKHLTDQANEPNRPQDFSGGGLRKLPSSALLAWFLPPSIAADFSSSLHDIYEERWLPAHGRTYAGWRWHRECISMIGRYWLQLLVATGQRLGRLK